MTREQTLQQAYSRGFEKAAQEASDTWRQQAASRDWSGDLSLANDYLARKGGDGKPLFGAGATGQHFVNAASNTLATTGKHIPVPVALAAGQVESSLGKSLKSKNNLFNVGNHDDGRKRDFKTMQDGINAYFSTVAKDYLPQHNGDMEALLDAGFKNYAGSPYASATNYADQVRSQRDFITNGTWRAKAPVTTPKAVTTPVARPGFQKATRDAAIGGHQAYLKELLNAKRLHDIER
jgi:hypothetical protein